MNSGWDKDSTFIVQLVSEDLCFQNPEEIKKDESLVKHGVDEGMLALVINGNHHDKAVVDLKAIHFTALPLPTKFLCKICVRVIKWNHFLISKKANFFCTATVEDNLYDRV